MWGKEGELGAEKKGRVEHGGRGTDDKKRRKRVARECRLSITAREGIQHLVRG